MLENLKKYKIVLASNSPRRRNLLSGLDIDFEVRIIPDIDESYPDSIDSMEIPLYIARSKAEAYKSTMADDELLITADTIVWTFDGVMGKPANREEAYAMLHALSDHVHQVITGVCIMTKDKNVGFSVESAVCFAKLGDEEINYYLDKYKPYDKAGSPQGIVQIFSEFSSAYFLKYIEFCTLKTYIVNLTDTSDEPVACCTGSAGLAFLLPAC